MLNPDLSFFENTIDPDQLASDEAIRSGTTAFSTLFEVHVYNWNAADYQGKIRIIVHKQNIKHDKGSYWN